MKKSRMYLLIAIPILALYLGSCLFMYYAARNTVAELFSSRVDWDLEVTTERLKGDYISSYKTPYGYVSYLSGGQSSDTDSFQYHLIDSDGNAIASSGSVLELWGTERAFEQEGLNHMDFDNDDAGDEQKAVDINISELLTDEMRTFLQDSDNIKKYGIRNDSNCVTEVSYYIKDNKIVPVSLTFKGADGVSDSFSADETDQDSTTSIRIDKEGQITFIFSNSKATKSLTVNHSSDPLEASLELDNFDCAYNGKHCTQTAARIREEFSEMLHADEEDGNSLHSTFGAIENLAENEEWSGSVGDDDAFTVWNVSVNGNPYMLVLAIGMDQNYEALHSSAFQEYIIEAGELFLILTFIALYVAGKMYDKNKKLNDSRLAFTSAVAHELKTPLAVIQTQCECIMEGVAPEKNEEYLSTIYKETRGMNRMVLSFLQYNRLSLTEKIPMTKEDITAIVREEIEKYQPMLEGDDRNVSFEIEDGIWGMINIDLFRLALDNFLSNAAKYTTPSKNQAKGWIAICLEKSGKGFRLRISNSCNNEKIATETIWNLLTKTDASRHRDENSSGMGLPLAAEILKLHKIKYECWKIKGGIGFIIEKN